MSSTSRKVPAPDAHVARIPTQERSRKRFDRLLTATATLLASRDMRSIGIYDIAKESKVPAASVYHFFPAPQAAFLEVARRRLDGLRNTADTPPADLTGIRNWPDLLVHRYNRIGDFYNSDPVLRQLFLYGDVLPEIRALDVEHTNSAGQRLSDFLNRFFIVPWLPNPEFNFGIVVALYDGIWMASCSRFGHISDSFRAEAHTAAISYCRTFLPEVLPFRPPAAETLAPHSSA